MRPSARARFSRPLRWWVPAVLAMSLIPAPVGAHDHAPPRVALVGDSHLQEGRIHENCWQTLAPQYAGYETRCETYSGRPWITFPRGVETRPGSAQIITTTAEFPPSSFTVRAWREVRTINDWRGRPFMDLPRGRPIMLTTSRIDPVLEPDMTLHWDVTVLLPTQPGHYYLEARGDWDCAEAPHLADCEQWAKWYLHALVA